MTSEEFPDALPLGTIVGGYRLTRVIGQGGFGITYEGVSAAGLTSRRVAIKEFFPRGHAYRTGSEIRLSGGINKDTWFAVQRRFESEALKLVDAYDHPAIVKGENFVREHGSSFLIMEYVEGPSLAQWLDLLAEPPGEGEIRLVIEPVLDAVAYLHARGDMHRDLSPHNILVRLERRGRAVLEPVLIDFGAAAEGLDTERVSSVVVANKSYAPLEQLRPNTGMQGAHTDIYALAGVLYYCVAGKAPVPAEERVAALTLGDAGEGGYVPATRLARRGAFSPAFLEAIDQALNIRPADRPNSIAAFRVALGWGPGRMPSGGPGLSAAVLEGVLADMEGLVEKEAPPPPRPRLDSGPAGRDARDRDGLGKRGGAARFTPARPARASDAGPVPRAAAPHADALDGSGRGAAAARSAGGESGGERRPRAFRVSHALAGVMLMLVLYVVGTVFLTDQRRSPPQEPQTSQAPQTTQAPQQTQAPQEGPPTQTKADSPATNNAELNTLLSACDGGDFVKCFRAGEKFAQGLGVPADQTRSVALFLKACDGGILGGCGNAALQYENGLGVSKDEARALALYMKACDGRDGRGCFRVGRQFDEGRGTAKDETQATVLYSKACDLGYAAGCNDAGYQYSRGLGVAKDQKRATELYLKACDGALPLGCNNAASLVGDPKRAFELRSKSCELSNAQGCFETAGAYITGGAVEKDEARGVSFLVKACELGADNGCINAAWHYSKGQGVPKSDEKATAFYLKACDGKGRNRGVGCGYAAAQFDAGLGTPVDRARGLRLYMRACSLGEDGACKTAIDRLKAEDGLSKSSTEARDFLKGQCAAKKSEACALAGL